MAKVPEDKRKGKQVKIGRRRSTSDHDLDALFDRFYFAKVAEGRSEGTLTNYRNHYRNLAEFMDEKGLARDVRHVTTDILRAYVVWMLEEKVRFDGHKYKPASAKTAGLSPVTVNTRMKSLRTFFGYLVAEALTDNDPTTAVKSVHEDEETIVVLSVSELKSLLDAPDQRSYAGFRDHVLMTFLLDTFLRVNAALSVRAADIDVSARTVTVAAQNMKSRRSIVLPLDRHTLRLLRELTAENDDFDSEHIFLANYGEPLTANHFRNRLRKHARKAGIGRRVHPHLFRHTAATMFLEAGGDIRHLQRLLGHRDIRMVMRYTHLSGRSLARQHAEYSPLRSVLKAQNKPRKINRKP